MTAMRPRRSTSKLLGTGSVLYAKWPQAAVWIVLFVVSAVWLARLLPGLGSWQAVPGSDAAVPAGARGGVGEGPRDE